jgi:hypothetical protein
LKRVLADLAIAQRYRQAAEHMRAKARTHAAAGDHDGARRLAQAAAAHDARVQQIHGLLERQLRLARTEPPEGFPYARQATNGHWYIPDESRPGRFKVVIG